MLVKTAISVSQTTHQDASACLAIVLFAVESVTAGWLSSVSRVEFLTSPSSPFVPLTLTPSTAPSPKASVILPTLSTLYPVGGHNFIILESSGSSKLPARHLQARC
ncbi:hypothetical protein SISSUDRAFT_1051752 [Sistotremastrum suecicum HHB10207 ss-3]|uniref:Uncharacterized protein n=1 Tax=Sistotremastrum suecicum HHB10207 ss-3 TaxID=1314776 RepID=A0A166ADC5_9AGAM|nr:hypothetical protein SISSUDRAFT_1051752 [Sistotremastrum suecicum HHB10207 ss-3]